MTTTTLPTGTNYEDRMTSATVNSVTTTFAYRGDGLRNSRTTGGNTTTFTWDIAGGLPVVLDDGARYVYGAGLVSQVSGVNTYYYMADGLGSTMKTVDATGTVVNGYTYDIYGKKTSSTGSQANEFDFAGEQTDPTGLQYLRARYMDPETGTFLSRDPLAVFSEWTDGHFAYASSNPVALTDPTGLVNCGDAECGGGGGGGIGRGGSTWWKPWTWGRSGQTIREYPKLRVDDENKILHVFQDKHNWGSTGLTQKDNIALIEKIAKDPGKKIVSRQLENGAWKESFESIFNGKTVHVEVFTGPGGIAPVVEDAWVILP